MYETNSTHVFPILLIFTCLHTLIFIFNLIKSHKITLFKIDKLMASINILLSILPAFIYATILIADNEEPTLTPFFIEWTISIPLLLINLGKLLNYSYYQHAFICASSVAMTLTGLASANATNVVTMFTLFSIGCFCYINIVVYLFVTYIKQIKICHNETNFPSQLSKNKINVFRLLFCLIATIWNGYPIALILWKTQAIKMENAMVIFVCLDFISKGLAII
jgi:hypothetical protein